MKYTLTCPANDGFVSVVEAANDDEAVTKLMEAGKEHAATVHSGTQGMSAEQVIAMIMAGWKKG
jgi:hypothetical protein